MEWFTFGKFHLVCVSCSDGVVCCFGRLVLKDLFWEICFETLVLGGLLSGHQFRETKDQSNDRSGTSLRRGRNGLNK